MNGKTKPSATKADTTPALVPKLRFPAFRGAPGWSNVILSDLSEVARGNSPRPIADFITSDVNGLNWLRIGDVDKEAKYVTRTEEKIQPEALGKTRIANPGDLILSNVPGFGQPHILQIKTCIHDGWIAITDITKKTDTEFLYYSISTPGSQSYIAANTAKSGIQKLNTDIIKALPTSFPPTPEQQKIVECLRSVDELIGAQARKVNALKTHKKGLMKQLFPRDGEALPRYRFPEFQSSSDWKKVTIGQVATFHNGKLFKQEELLESGKYPVLREENLLTGNLRHYSNLELSETKYCENGDLLYSYSESVGPRIWRGNKAIYDRHIWKVIAQRGIDKGFLFITLKNATEKMKPRTTTGFGVMHITKNTMEEWETTFPYIAEQRKIADCLTMLDDTIAAEIQKLNAIKRHKAGLMQQIFPSLVTIRS